MSFFVRGRRWSLSEAEGVHGLVGINQVMNLLLLMVTDCFTLLPPT
ncbi:MAG: hypothetical protein ACJAZ9_002040 [Neolewinella sp.]|jgi:hypothetical protein